MTLQEWGTLISNSQDAAESRFWTNVMYLFLLCPQAEYEKVTESNDERIRVWTQYRCDIDRVSAITGMSVRYFASRKI